MGSYEGCNQRRPITIIKDTIMTTKKIEQEINQIDEAIEWLEEFTANLKAGNTITKAAAKEFSALIDALSSLTTVKGETNKTNKTKDAPVGKLTVIGDDVPYTPKGKITWEGGDR
jgi:hypothetical protein